MLSIEFPRGGCAEAGHLHLRDFESVSIYCINDFTNISVSIRLNHAKCALSIDLESLSSGNITVVGDLELTAIHSDNGTHEEVLHRLDALEGASLQEHPFVFLIVL